MPATAPPLMETGRAWALCGMSGEGKIVDSLREVLEKQGIGSQRIVCEKEICLDGRKCARADLIVLDEECRFVVAAFEIQKHVSNEIAWIDRMRSLMSRVVGLCNCFLVTQKDSKVVFARLDGRPHTVKWASIEDLNVAPICRAMREKEIDKEADPLRVWIGGVAIGVGAVLLAVEINHELSWQFCFLFALLVALFAAASGYKIHVRVPGGEVTVGGDSTDGSCSEK